MVKNILRTGKQTRPKTAIKAGDHSERFCQPPRHFSTLLNANTELFAQAEMPVPETPVLVPERTRAK